MSDTSGQHTPDPAVPGSGDGQPAVARAAAGTGWKTLGQVALIVAAVLLAQRVLLPMMGIGT